MACLADIEIPTVGDRILGVLVWRAIGRALLTPTRAAAPRDLLELLQRPYAMSLRRGSPRRVGVQPKPRRGEYGPAQKVIVRC